VEAFREREQHLLFLLIKEKVDLKNPIDSEVFYFNKPKMAIHVLKHPLRSE
jgi:hypothetical protein